MVLVDAIMMTSTIPSG